MAETISLRLPADLLSEVDSTVEGEELYTNRTDLIKYAIRRELQRNQVEE